ncbi:MAG: ATP-binding protein [Bacteroidales bacterium]|nr:ATP-binding protein [Candidatus Equimonas faecalis]
MQAKYISRIVIDSLWQGHKHIDWVLRPGVNVLSGKNGAGKSTILNRIVSHLAEVLPLEGALAKSTAPGGVTLEFMPAEADTIRYDIVRSFDRQLIRLDNILNSTEVKIRTELDWQLYQLQRRYLDYQVNVGNRMIQLLTSGDPTAQQQATAAAGQKRLFQDMVDELFRDTAKTIDRSCNELRFLQYGEPLLPYLLSSGEKQLLIILLTALTEDAQPCVLFMDEPEASLHFEWQKVLLSMVTRLNPNAQIILTTHSPAVIMDGWADCVTEVEEIER